MKLATAMYQGKVFIGVKQNDQILDPCETSKRLKFDFPYETLQEGIEDGDIFLQKVNKMMKETKIKGGVLYPFEDITLLAPIPRPKKNVMCVGKNYALHAIELGSKEDIPTELMVFTKASTVINGPD